MPKVKRGRPAKASKKAKRSKSREVFSDKEIDSLKAKLVKSKLPFKDFLRKEKLIDHYTTIYARLRPTGVLSTIPVGKRGRKSEQEIKAARKHKRMLAARKAAKSAGVVKAVKEKVESTGKRGKRSSLSLEFVKTISDSQATSGLSFKDFLAKQNVPTEQFSKIYQAVHKFRKSNPVSAVAGEGEVAVSAPVPAPAVSETAPVVAQGAVTETVTPTEEAK